MRGRDEANNERLVDIDNNDSDEDDNSASKSSGNEENENDYINCDRDELSYVIFVLINYEEEVERPAIINSGRANKRTVIIWFVF